MARNRFDQACRYAAKLDPAGFLTWLGGPSRLRWRGWLDTRTLPFPGDPERTCDTVAWLEEPGHPGHWAIAIEFNLSPDQQMFGRLLVYLGQLWLERRSESGGRFQVAAAVVNLTGTGSASLDMRLGPFRTCLQAVERNLSGESSDELLTAIAGGTTARALLPWIPLLHGGGDPAIINRWKVLAAAEPDRRRQADYGGLALVFAEAADRRNIWKEALKGWNMVESQQVLDWIAEGEVKGRAEGKAEGRAEGMAEGKAEDVLHILAKQFPPGAPPDLAALIRSCKDVAKLSDWLDAALDAKTLDEFRQQVRSEERNGA